MHYLFNSPLIRYVQKLKYHSFNHELLLNWIVLWSIVIVIFWSAYSVVLWARSVCCHPLTYIMVTGKRNYTTNADIHHTIEKLGTLGTFVTQDINLIQKKIERLPWIKQASIRKRWPDTLHIHVVEHIPVALWNDSYIVSTTGMIFNISKKYKNNSILLMPILYGPSGSEQKVLIYYYIFNEILKKSTMLQIKSLTVDIRNSWELILKNNICLKLGRNNIIERLNYFVKIYPVLLFKSNEINKSIDYIDLRYTVGFVVKWIPHIVNSVLCKK